MTEQPKQRQVIREWAQKAKGDLVLAEHALTLPIDTCPFDLVCFHAQQSVEKYLKAILMLHEISIPRTHDISEIAELLPKNVLKDISLHEIASLTPYAVQSRYPGIGDEQDETEARSAVRIAKQLQDAITRALPKD